MADVPPRSPVSPKTPQISPLSPRQSISKSISWSAEMDSDALFSNHTVVEIRAVENKTRSDIERKKEDLRLMVGERYRDLIDAADTVTEMKTCSKQVMSFVQDIQKQCKELHSSHRCHGFGGSQSVANTESTSQTKAGFYTIASQMKLLVNTPEKVWSALERKQYLKAAQLYLFSRHIVSILHIDTGDSSAPKLLSSFPILPKQWAAISHFKDSILQGSRALLSDASQTEEMLAESLCSILLLEESSPRQVFTEFLLARKAALQEVFHPCQHATSIKSQVCEVVQIIRRSLYQIHALFCGPPEGDLDSQLADNPALVFKTIADVIKRESSSPNSDEESLEVLFGPDFDLVTSARFLPKSVLEYRPQVRAFPSSIPRQNINHNCSEWISMCAKDVTAGVSSLLKYIGTLKGLASVRDAVWDLLKEAALTSSSSDQAIDWTTLCNSVLGHDLSIWDEFLQPLFLARAKAILRGLLDATVSSCKNVITKSQDEISEIYSVDLDVLWERDIAMYVWHESPNDVPRSADSTLPYELDSGLALKARACTPAVQRLCKSVDCKLAALLEDCQYFISDEQKNKYPELSEGKPAKRISDASFLTSNRETSFESQPFDRFGDCRQIQAFLQETCFSALNELLEFIDGIIRSHKDKLTVNSGDTSSGKSQQFDTICVDRVLFVGRLCHSFISQCRHIKQIMDGGSTADAKSRTLTRTPKTSSSNRRKEDAGKHNNMEELGKSFKERYFASYRLWKDWISVQFLASLEASLLLCDNATPLLSMTNWEEIKIEEESEDGKKVESVIRVPAQLSSYVTSLLFSLCQELNRIGAHALDRKLLHELVTSLSRGVLTSHEKLIQENKPSITQNQALQVLFDLKVLTAILVGRGEDETSEQVIESLESCVDPFDLDVFTPYVALNVSRQLQRCGVLFGVVASLDKHSTHSFGATQRPSSGSHDQHNVMPLAPNPPRFTLLPLSFHLSPEIGAQTADLTRKMGPSRSQGEGFVTRTAFFNHQQFFNKNVSKRQALLAT
ncbi:PREDICTED: conserved oligomeric Golgi complex subunit 1-like isoform X1 [Acropora digitifera]|uniref:conserved oligomeric Golgi complex subunit 1-like isoform X1 n=2 Tax=Acropora digitifera TaxID=70779 RepID=UPI00077A9E8B|nr:PREDICTED: conserved oligomeric Golgi complex subunit 1-like isoform X1 [Acropora digitifera]